MEDGWIEWAGGECPVPGWTIITARLRDGRQRDVFADSLYWDVVGSSEDVVAYRIADEMQ